MENEIKEPAFKYNYFSAEAYLENREKICRKNRIA